MSHSWSPLLFRRKCGEWGVTDCTYGLYDCQRMPDLHALMTEEGLVGLNVTSPYKEQAFMQMDSLSPVARAIGAVNYVRRLADGGLQGDNTDAQAFGDTLARWLGDVPRRALVLGSGGAAKAVCHALRGLGVAATVVSRSPRECRSDAFAVCRVVDYRQACNLVTDSLLLVNATPVGMGLLVEDTPWPYPQMLTPAHCVYDLIYNPSPTRLLREAAARRAATQDGLAMLERQAELSWGRTILMRDA